MFPLKMHKISGKFKITPVTPIHISDTEKYNKFEYYIYRNRFYLKDLLKFFRDNAEDYDTAVKIIRDLRFSPGPKYIRYTLPVYIGNSNNDPKEFSQPTEWIYAFIKDPFGRPFIPGSSLKGCIRTAITYSLIKRIEGLSTNIFEEVCNFREKAKKDNKALYKRNLQEILNKYLIPLNDAKYDLFKALVIRDSQPFPYRKFNSDYFEIPHFGICEGRKVVKKYDTKQFNITHLMESLLPDLDKPIEIPFTIDKSIIDNIIRCPEEDLVENRDIFEELRRILSDKEEFTSALKEFYEALKNAQKRYFDNTKLKGAFKGLLEIFGKGGDAIYLQIGFGTGYLSKTIALVYDDEKIIELQKNLHLGKGKYSYPVRPYPCSRILTTSVNTCKPSLLMGWFKLEIEWDNQ